MRFFATRTGHTQNAKALLLKTGQFTAKQVDAMNSADVDYLITERYVSVVLQEEAGNYDNIYLIPRQDWQNIIRIPR